MVISDYIRFAAYCLISLCCYLFLAYTIERSDFGWLIVAFGILFVTYFLILRESRNTAKYLSWGIVAAVLCRLVLLLAIPILSDDVYRFIWDGNLFIHGINPFLHIPETLMQAESLPFLSESLYNGLNSAEYYSVYPPVCQFIFGISAGLFGEQLLGNIVVMRLFILAAELGTLWILKKLLNYYDMNPIYLLAYALNPLIILELTGNLHFEAILIFFLLFAFYLFLRNQYLWAVILFALAVNTKLMPLLLLPYLAFSLGGKRTTYFITILIAVTVLMHFPFLDPSVIEHFSSSLGLYFQSFEFNASIYYLVRWIGYHLAGYNIIQTAGPALAIISTTLIIAISWKLRDRRLDNLPMVFLLITAIYYLFATTVHPWYLSPLLVFVPLTGMFFPLAWSAVIPLTYFTYTSTPYTENLWLVALEYVIVVAIMAYDYYYRPLPVSRKMSWLFRFVGTDKNVQNRF